MTTPAEQAVIDAACAWDKHFPNSAEAWLELQRLRKAVAQYWSGRVR